MTTTTQEKLQKDIEYCIDYLELDDTQIGNLLRACEQLSDISCEYFCEEFVFESNTEEDHDRLHDPNYLTINWGLN